MGSVGPSTLVATPLPWISKGSPLPPSPSPLSLSSGLFLSKLRSPGPSVWGHPPWCPPPCPGSPRAAPSLPLPLHCSSPSRGAAPPSEHHGTAFFYNPAPNTLFVL